MDKLNGHYFYNEMNSAVIKSNDLHTQLNVKFQKTFCWDKETRKKLIHNYDTICVKFRKDQSYPKWQNLGQWWPVVRGWGEEVQTTLGGG